MKSRMSLLKRLVAALPLWCVLSLGCDRTADQNGSKKSTPIDRPTTAPRESVNESPTAVIVDTDLSPPGTGAPRLYELSASQSADRDGTVVSYEWDFGDGTTVASGESVRHSYKALGRYFVTLTVTDDHGATGIARRLILADDQAPIITSIRPTVVPNESSPTIWIRGKNLGRVVRVDLTSPEHPLLYKMNMKGDETELITEFNTFGAEPGVRSVIVTDRFGRTFTLDDALRVVQKD